MDKNELHHDDILGTLEISEALLPEATTEVQTIANEERINTELVEASIKTETITEEKEHKKSKILHYFIFTLKYSFTSGFIFMMLLVSTNFSAYFNVAKWYVFQWKLQESEQSLINSVQAGNIETDNKEVEKIVLEARDKKYEDKAKEMGEKDEKVFHSINKIAAKAKSSDVNLDIEIAPYENRIIIPKIGKNIPLLDVKQKEVEGLVELNNIFMEELENGVVRYPGSAVPWETGNTFVFWHSSNFPWLDGDYKDVFALLYKLGVDDEVIVYYGQKKYTYRIKTKTVVKPGDVSILKRDKWISELTLMTCWPVGTTLNRMILIGELVEE